MWFNNVNVALVKFLPCVQKKMGCWYILNNPVLCTQIRVTAQPQAGGKELTRFLFFKPRLSHNVPVPSVRRGGQSAVCTLAAFPVRRLLSLALLSEGCTSRL